MPNHFFYLLYAYTPTPPPRHHRFQVMYVHCSVSLAMKKTLSSFDVPLQIARAIYRRTELTPDPEYQSTLLSTCTRDASRKQTIFIRRTYRPASPPIAQPGVDDRTKWYVRADKMGDKTRGTNHRALTHYKTPRRDTPAQPHSSPCTTTTVTTTTTIYCIYYSINTRMRTSNFKLIAFEVEDRVIRVRSPAVCTGSLRCIHPCNVHTATERFWFNPRHCLTQQLRDAIRPLRHNVPRGLLFCHPRCAQRRSNNLSFSNDAVWSFTAAAAAVFMHRYHTVVHAACGCKIQKRLENRMAASVRIQIKIILHYSLL